MRRRLEVILALSLGGAIACTAQQVTLRHSSNLRQDPTTSSTIIETVNTGDTVTLTAASTKAGYYPARATDGKVGWIWAKNVVPGNKMTSMRLALPHAASQEFAQSCANPAYPNSAETPIDSVCGESGSGGAEAAQNEAKNNFCAGGAPNAFTIQDLTSLQKKVQDEGNIPFGNPRSHPLSPQPGPATDRTGLVSLGEGSAVVLTGYVKIARQEGAESVNCGKNVPNQPVYHDIHISIVSNPDDTECSGVVAEMIPHHRPAAWTPQILAKVASSKVPVRLTGDLMFDSSHSPCADGAALPGDPSRISLWEVHPIYKFEVCTAADCSTGDGWVALESWQP
jgi:hypothetical protein